MDIVERLRDYDPTRANSREAADTIERLRAENEDLRTLPLMKVETENRELRAEIERLKAKHDERYCAMLQAQGEIAQLKDDNQLLRGANHAKQMELETMRLILVVKSDQLEKANAEISKQRLIVKELLLERPVRAKP